MLETETERQELSVMPVNLPVEWDDLKEFRDTGVIVSIQPPERSKLGKRPVNLEVSAPIRKGDLSLLNYIGQSLISYNSRLIPFVWNEESVRLLARHYHIRKTSSINTLRTAALSLNSFTEFIEKSPDEIIYSLVDHEEKPIPKVIKRLKRDIEDWQAELKAHDYAPNTIKNGVGVIKSWLNVNDVDVGKLPTPQGYVKYPGRSFTEKEIQQLIDIGNLRDKVIVSILATSGLRIDTLAKLKYEHVRADLEAGKIPVCIYIKADETKGKYGDYFTFINEEAVDYLKLYLDERRRGKKWDNIKPEQIDDDSPLIRDSRSKKVKTVSKSAIYMQIHQLMERAGLITLGSKKRHELNVHSLRKWFKTHMTVKGVHGDYVEFFMGHVMSTYQDVKSLGVEELRKIYRNAGLSIRPKSEVSKVDQLKTIAESLGMDPDKIVYKGGYAGPHRTVIGEDSEIEALQEAIRNTLTELVSESSK